MTKNIVDKTDTKQKKTPAKKPAAKNLVIVESPAKAKTLKKFLGSSYIIDACMGHVRDLPKSELGIDIENDFEPKYITIRGKGELLSKLRKEVKSAKKVYLATDPDREGEAISWHLMHALKLFDKECYRITFNEITESAVKKSIKEARELDMQLVDAQQARRSLDRIVGYKISPLLWAKVKKGLSAGRVQSVTLKIICDREEEIENFEPEEYWTIDTEFSKSENGKKKNFSAHFYGIQKDGESVKTEIKTRDDADKIVTDIEKSEFCIREIKKGKRAKKPSPPFTTSTLQQESSKTFGYTTAKTMQIAQQLYEGVELQQLGTIGLVSYIRTDSVRISDDAYNEANKYILENFSKEYLPENRNEYKSKGRLQDAHEAIRPTYVSITPDSIKASLTKEQFKLYSLIWERFLASQMAPADYDTVSVKISAGDYIFRASGSILKFDGFQRVYKKDEDEKGEQVILPELSEGEILKLSNLSSQQHFTQPPPRFTEAMLIKTLEENGVGRPSTYAPTITTILQRRYVIKENKAFFPTELGEIVNEIMKNNFKDIVNIDFTAKMEEDLDSIEDGKIDWKGVIRSFYPPFEKELSEAQEKINEIEIKDEETDIICENCGRNMVIKFGKFGKFLACPGFPECKNALPFFEEAGVNCPVCNSRVLIKKTKKGRRYYGCEKNPECSFISWNKPTGEICPECGEFLIEKGSKNKKIVCVNNQCSFSKEYIEVE